MTKKRYTERLQLIPLPTVEVTPSIVVPLSDLPDDQVVVTNPADQACRACDCTNELACPGGCWWVERVLCSACARKDRDR